MILITSLFFFAAALAPEQAHDIGLRVWQNECAGTLDGLVSWNEGEEFASLGIGHFIWYPKGERERFVETFPKLLQFLQSKGVQIPRWLEEARHCPWKNREVFRRSKNDKKITDLRRILKETVGLQAQFLSIRLEEAMPLLLANAPDELKAKIIQRYERVTALPNGAYALLDYVNFKGYGTDRQEQYGGWGWGLFQVLMNMSDDPKADPLALFVKSAKEILERRIDNSPTLRNEQRYLKGWFNRLDSYLSK